MCSPPPSHILRLCSSLQLTRSNAAVHKGGHAQRLRGGGDTSAGVQQGGARGRDTGNAAKLTSNRSETALSGALRAMSQLTTGRLCVAGSYALYRHCCSPIAMQPPQWVPGDIDIFYCSSGSQLDGEELRKRLHVLAWDCQIKMLSSSRAAGGFWLKESLHYPDEEWAYDADSQATDDEQWVAAFARDQLVSLCSREPPHSERCARARAAVDARRSAVLRSERVLIS